MPIEERSSSNYQLIYQLLYQEEGLSKQDIVKALSLSLPTISNNLEKLEKVGLVTKAGHFQSEGGRPAVRYSIVDKARTALSLEIRGHVIHIAAVNLRGEITSCERVNIQHQDDEAYYQQLVNRVQVFIQQLRLDPAKILGLGISLQALIDTDQKTITYAQVLPYQKIRTDFFQEALGIPTYFYHDVACAAKAELWHQKTSEAVYLSISEHLGSALILGNRIDQSPYGQSGAIEHMRIAHQGRRCYCGQDDCLETYCSLDALLKEGEKRAHFFPAVRRGKPEAVERWQDFLRYLGDTLANLYLILARPIILGGEIAGWLEEEDIQTLYQMIDQQTPFPLEEDIVQIASIPHLATLNGAALGFLEDFLNGPLT